jgi:hypothetical protein
MGPFRALGQFFAMLFSFCAAGERLGKSLEHLAEIAEQESEGLKQQMQLERQDRISKLSARLAVALPAPVEE